MVDLVGLVVDSFGGWIVGWLDGWLVWWLDCNSKLETEIGEAGLGSYDAGNRHPLVSQTFRLNLTLNLSQNFNRAFCSDFANLNQDCYLSQLCLIVMRGLFVI